MSEQPPAVKELTSLPRSERSEFLEEVVVAEFRDVLLMGSGEDFPTDQSYFSMGFTSLRIMEVKARLETVFGCALSTNALFNSPTIEKLLEYLADEVLGDLIP
ncbi:MULTISPECIES: acyl carrier protein [unclassified Streptomyces]|uniref:acyl carrier protein n=1 Tax=unclassified Streptomyces TaxID=2593676 RepID=UPI00381BF889|nr:acyl carrier protein [Streptomyces sp. NBC_01185]